MKRTRASRGQNTVYYVDSKQCWISQGYFNGKRLTASSKKLY